jgi:hypothetical protein
MYQQMEQPYIGMAGGGLPSLSAPMAPMAQQVQSQGRDEDTMLVHMTPNEVNSLQGLAMAHGGSLTINPETGLPEAGFLKKLIPTLLGAALAATGIGAPLAAGLVAAGSVAKTGSLKKGLMAGLQAFGGAGLAGAAGLGGSISSNAFGALSSKAGMFGANMGLGATVPTALTGAAAVPTAAVPTAAANVAPGFNAAAEAANMASLGGQAAANVAPGFNAAAEAANMASLGGATQTLASSAPAQFTGGLGSRFAQAARSGLPGGTPGIIAKNAPMLAASGLMQGVGGAMSGRPSGGSSGAIDNSYQGPYYAQDRQRIEDPDGANSSKQRRHFAVDMPEIYNTMGQVVQPGSQTKRGTQIMQPVFNPKAKKGKPMYDFRPTTYMGGVDPQEEEEENAGYAHGGEVQLSDGAFVLDARTVSEIGNGSSNAGMEALSRMGGRPVQGPGDGVSDSVPARIGGNQPARVARDEVIMPSNVVRRIGKGNPQRGADKLYSLMDKAHKARKQAGRGHDTKLRRGLG